MKNIKITAPAILLVISVGTYFRIISDGSTRTVEFISIFAIGVLAGIVLTEIFENLSNKK